MGTAAYARDIERIRFMMDWAPGPPPDPEQAQLLEWQLVLSSTADVEAAGRSLRAAGHELEPAPGGFVAAHPWHTRMHVVAGE